VTEGGQVILHFYWEENSLQCQETYGPWAVSDDDDMLPAGVRDFIGAWRRLAGIRPNAVTIALVIDPDTWIREHGGCGARA
jgi:hypothetical protein